MATTTMAMAMSFTYEACLAASERIRWRVEDIIGGDKRLDFTKPLLPEALARVDGLDFLGSVDRLVLNQIRGHGYLYMFGLVEEFILPFVLDHARPHLSGDDARVRALLGFASEEAKHIDLFKRFRADFAAGFGSPCAVIGPPEAIARHVLAQDPLSVALLILHIEWMTQAHWLEAVRDDRGIDPLFKSLLKHHWMEESQHARLDTLMVEALAAGRTEAEILAAVDGYLALGLFIDDGLATQARFDRESLEKALDRALPEAEARQVEKVQHQALRFTFIGSGLTHPSVLETLERLSPAARRKVEQVSSAFL